MFNWLLRFALLAVTASVVAAPPKASPFPKVPADGATAATARARELAVKAAAQLKRELSDRETTHFLIYADWSARDVSALAIQLEQTLADVVRQFGVEPKETSVLVGKMLVLALSDREAFELLAKNLDDQSPDGVSAGYFRPHADGAGHLLLCRPVVDDGASNLDIDRARDGLRATLAHELTLAVIERYADRTSLPSWICRGIASLMQRSLVPDFRIDLTAVRHLAGGDFDPTFIFDPELPPGMPFDLAAMTMVEMLLDQDRQAFVEMLNDLRTGTDGVQALRKAFKLSYAEAGQNWRRFVQTR